MVKFFRTLKTADRHMILNLFFLYFIQGFFVILIGSILPMIREDYGLDYEVSGLLLSSHNIGNAIAGLLMGLLPLLLGLKNSLLAMNAITFIGFFIVLLTREPMFLIFALLLTGLGRGAISNVNNMAVSALSKGSATPLNALHASFAIGAVVSPVVVLICSASGIRAWRTAVWVVIILGLISMVSSFFMNMGSVSHSRGARQAVSFRFLKERSYIYAIIMNFFYLCVEGSIMGWVVTYYIDTGIVSEDSTQLLTSVLWISILIGRMICSVIGKTMSPARMLRILSSGLLVSLLVLLISQNQAFMWIATISLGLFMSGMYGTLVADAGDVFGTYPLAMSIFITLTSLGSSLMPPLVGLVAERSGMHTGMGTLLFPAAILFVMTIFNRNLKRNLNKT